MSELASPLNSLVGTWKVLSFQIEFEDSDERDEPYGTNPDGYVVLTDKRLIAVITRPKRAMDQSAANLFDSMMAYSGRYRLQGDDCFITTVDSTWLPAWHGTEQVRYFKINEGVLSVVGLFRENPKYPGRRVRGVLTGRKE
ncbi:lipocalin-like domain-containing protein [Bradyrhizobium lablabi]|uniref:lipocalin-like domain-containing protein n=1 Tax=Bradyrhizobium lablabi TaxID=722472 RepID=UPI001BAAF520|nr:lipocalin-like domain-containing protein [Bradyrhizobium lablabi]MBR0691993.1 lipocalin-like domain-containing protein [Bradyrhizobium lablabi]